MTDDKKPTQEEHEKAMAAIEANSMLQLARIEKKLGLPEGYYKSLREGGTDWEFAIKLVVVLEAALGAVMAAHTQNPVLADHYARLSLEGRAGKLNLAVDLGILTKPERTAYQSLATVRNTFAHHVENIERSLQQFAEAMPAEERTKVVKGALQVPKEVEDKVKFLWEHQETVSLVFRQMLWTAGSMLLEGLATQDVRAEVEAERLKRLQSGTYWTLGDMFRTGGLRLEPSLLGTEDSKPAKGGLLGDWK